MNLPETEQIPKSSARLSVEDGISEIFYGFALVLIGLAFFVEAALGPRIRSLGSGGLIVVSLGAFFSGRWLLPKFRSALTVATAGAAVNRQISAGIKLLVLNMLALAGLFIAGVCVLAIRSGSAAMPNWLALANGLVVGLFLAWAAAQTRLKRFWAVAAVSALAGLIIFLTRLAGSLGAAAYFFALGAALMTSGGVALKRFLRRLTEKC